MVWDKTLPPGNTKISVGDNSIRDNNAQIETAVDIEHAFVTGGVQTGRHSFDRDTVINRDSPSVAYENGGVFFATDVRTGRLVMQMRDGGAWENVDLEPMDPATGLIPTLPRLDARSDFIVSQFATWAQVVPAAGTPMTVAVDYLLSPAKYATITAATLISNPVNVIAGKTSTVRLELVMNATGGHAITFGSAYRTENGATPSVSTIANARSSLYLTVMQDGNIHVASSSDIKAIV